MLIKILPGEYLFSSDGYHILNSVGYAETATEEIEVDVTNEAQLPVILAYQQFVRPEVTNVE